MLVNSKEILNIAHKKGFSIPSTNFIDSSSARAYTNIAEKMDLPLILSYAQSHRQILLLEDAAAIGKHYAKKASTPVVLHLDHGEDKDFIFKAIELGFTSVMIDGSKLLLEDNIKITKEIAEYAHTKNVTVEAELGHVGANDTSESYEITDSIYTEVEDVINFVSKTNVDSLAISIGTAHGLYKGTPEINFDRLKEIRNITDVPLVLHGGSSSGYKNLEKCALNGISKINVYTDFITAAFNEIKNHKFIDYIGMKDAADKSMEEVLKKYYEVFNTQKIEL